MFLSKFFFRTGIMFDLVSFQFTVALLYKLIKENRCR